MNPHTVKPGEGDISEEGREGTASHEKLVVPGARGPPSSLCVGGNPVSKARCSDNNLTDVGKCLRWVMCRFSFTSIPSLVDDKMEKSEERTGQKARGWERRPNGKSRGKGGRKQQKFQESTRLARATLPSALLC